MKRESIIKLLITRCFNGSKIALSDQDHYAQKLGLIVMGFLQSIGLTKVRMRIDIVRVNQGAHEHCPGERATSTIILCTGELRR